MCVPEESETLCREQTFRERKSFPDTKTYLKRKKSSGGGQGGIERTGKEEKKDAPQGCA